MALCRNFSLAGLLATTLLAAPAAAEPDVRVSLDWRAPQGCPTRAEVLSETARLLGQGDAAKPLHARGIVLRKGAKYVLQLATQLDGSHGFRRLQATHCAELTQPAALVLALSIDPNVLTRQSAAAAPGQAPPPVTSAVGSLPPAQPTAEPLPPPPVAAPPSAPKAPAATRAVSPSENAAGDARLDSNRAPEHRRSSTKLPLHARAGAGGALDAGTLPDAAFGGTLVLAGGYDRLELEARGALFAAQTKDVGASAAGDLGLTSGALSACFRALDIARLSACAGGEAGRLSGKGVGVSDPGSGAVWLWTGLVGARASQDIGEGVALWVRVDAALAVNRPRFVLENVGAVHQRSRIGGRGALGAEVRFP